MRAFLQDSVTAKVELLAVFVRGFPAIVALALA